MPLSFPKSFWFQNCGHLNVDSSHLFLSLFGVGISTEQWGHLQSQLWLVAVQHRLISQQGCCMNPSTATDQTLPPSMVSPCWMHTISKVQTGASNSFFCWPSCGVSWKPMQLNQSMTAVQFVPNINVCPLVELWRDSMGH